jgi:hypothetical protein
MTLGVAKEVIHRNLPADQQAAAERLWDQIIPTVQDIDDQ